MSGISKNLIAFAFAVAAIVGACSTIDKPNQPPEVELFPPDAANWPINISLFAQKDFESIDLFLSRVVTENPNQSTEWWADFRRAQLWTKKDPNVACENFARLAQAPQFPLQRLAFLKAHEACPSTNQILKRLPSFDGTNFDPWLSGKALDVSILKAEQAKQYDSQIDLYLKKSKLNLPLEEKIDWTKKALKIAEKRSAKAEVRRIQQRLYRFSPSEDPAPARRDFIGVAQDFRRRRIFDSAKKYYQLVIQSRKSRPSEVIQAYMGLRNSYRIQQDRPMALKVSQDLVNYTKKFTRGKKASKADFETYVDKALLYARSLWTEEQKSKALKTLNLVEKKAKGKASMSELYWIRGRMAEEDKDYQNALTYYDLALSEKGISKSFQNRLQWYKAWSLRKLNRLDEAIGIYKIMTENAEDNFDQIKSRFWLAKSYQGLKKDGKAEDEFEEIIDLEPNSYYGYLAYRELNKALPKVEGFNLNTELKAPKPLKAFYDSTYFEWLVAVREDEIARDYLDSVVLRIKSKFAEDSEDIDDQMDTWTFLMQLYARSNNYPSLFSQLQALDDRLRRTLIQNNPGILFPQPYQEFVDSSATRFGISPEFIYSIMRQESAFNPQARSHMDAFGLMQLIPQVAEKSALENNISMTGPEDLYEPHINIPLGSAHLRKLWDHYSGDLVLAVASYNASEKAILNWLNTRYTGDSLEFIEDIPYDETREYVKLVMRNLITYKILSTNADKQNFPEWALHINRKPGVSN